MERRGLSQEETLKQLVDASAKFRLLKIMLPQLKKRGHRVLLFSQVGTGVARLHKLKTRLSSKLSWISLKIFWSWKGINCCAWYA